MFTRTLVWRGPLVNGKQPKVPCPPADNGIILQARPVDSLINRLERKSRFVPWKRGL